MLVFLELIKLIRVCKLDFDDLTGRHFHGRRSWVVTTTRELHSEPLFLVIVIDERLESDENEGLCST